MLRAFVLAVVGISTACAEGVAAENRECSNSEADIATDRPDVTNSSRVVPNGSVQVENGVNWTIQQRETVIDGSNSRARFGVAECTEVLFDLPNYFHSLRGSARAGFSDF